MGKNNVQLREEKNTVIQHWGLRKLSVGVASVLLGTTAYLGMSNGTVVHADTVTANDNNENVIISNNETLSQNLYQSNRIQLSKPVVNTNSVENTQTTSQNVTGSKNNSNVVAANSSNKQIDGQQNYQQAEQSVSTEKQLNPYLVLAAQDNNNSNSNSSTELNDNNSWGSTIRYTYGTDAQLTEDQKKIGYVADSSKAGQAVYPDSQIKVGFDSQQNQMKVTVDGQKVSFTQKDKGYKTGTSDVATDYDNLKVKHSIAHITYQFVDDDDHGALVGKAVTVSGNNVDFKLSIPDNYGLVVGQVFPTKVDASVNGKSYVVHLCHLKAVTARVKPVKRVINYVDEQGYSLHQSVTQKAGIIVEYGNKDLVTGDVVWGQYHADVSVGNVGGAFPEYHLPQYEGFTSYVNGVKSTVIPKEYVTYDANGKPVQLDTTVEVTYQSDKDLGNPSQPEIDSESNDDQSGDTLTAWRTILIHEPNGIDNPVIQSIKFVKDHDQKTLAAVTNPQIAGYYTTSQQVDGVTVDYESADKLVKTVNVVYHLAPESLHVHFYDVDGNLIQSANVNGKYGQTIDVHSVLPAGWQLYAGQIVPDAVKLGVYNADLAFVLDHKIAEIKPEMNVSTTDAIPGTNHLTYPSEVLSSNLNRDLVYTVNVKDPDGKIEQKVFKQHVSRSAYLDLVTGKVVGYTNWTNNGQHMFNAFVAQPKDGYMINTLPAVTLDVDHPAKTVNVSYVPKTVNGQVVYKTFDGQTVGTQNFIGNQLVNFTVPTGYKLATEVTSLQPTNEAGQKYIVYVVPQAMTYTSHDDNKPANVGDLAKTVTRTINIKLANGRTRTIRQAVRFERTARVDASGKVTYSNWQAIGQTKFNAIYLPKRAGYHVVIKFGNQTLNRIGLLTDVTADMGNLQINVEYVKD